MQFILLTICLNAPCTVKPYVNKREKPTMRNFISRFVSDQSGATAIEYGLIAAGIAVVIIAAVNAVGTALDTKLSAAATAINP